MLRLICYITKFTFLILILVSGNIYNCYDTESSAVINTKLSAVKAGQEVLFTWENVDGNDIDPKITFWDYNSSPFLDKNFIEGSWRYLNDQSKYGKTTTSSSGQLLIKAPRDEGLYKIYYCYTRYREFKCNYIRTLAVVTCGGKDFKSIKAIIEKNNKTRKIEEFRFNQEVQNSHNNNKTNMVNDTKNHKSVEEIKEINNNYNSTNSESYNHQKESEDKSKDLGKNKTHKTSNTIIPPDNEIYKNNRNKIKEKDFKNKLLKNGKQGIISENTYKTTNEKISRSNIEHIIIFISENHSFDSIFGRYCKASTESNPTCNTGPECCEAAPQQLHGIRPFDLTDTQNSRYDPCHHMNCENSEINGGKMNKFLLNGVGSHPYNFAVANGDLFSAQYYYKFASNGALADNFYQSSTGASDQNNMYFATAKFLFMDNNNIPQSREINGAKCFKEGAEEFKVKKINGIYLSVLF